MEKDAPMAVLAMLITVSEISSKPKVVMNLVLKLLKKRRTGLWKDMRKEV